MSLVVGVWCYFCWVLVVGASVAVWWGVGACGWLVFLICPLTSS